MYDNETVVGEGIARADPDRADLVVATKVWVDDLAPGDVARIDGVEREVELFPE